MNGIKAKDDVKKLDRYPGLRPFVKEDSSLFFGRNTEILQLVDSIKVNKTLVLFGKSGLGKSSLVQAGVTPKLIEDGFFPMTIRFLDQKGEPLAAIFEQINSQLKNSTPTKKTGDDLIRLFKTWRLPQKPVLIFDQFEEFFYYPPERRERAIAELASLLNQSSIIAIANEGPVAMPLRDKLEEATVKMDVSPKMLFLIRSDRYNLMNELAEKIPGLFNNRFELKPLLKPKAEQSIVLPGQISKPSNPDLVFKVLPYRYSVEALQIILKSLSNKEEEIESSQLQILCQELEEIVQKDFGSLAAAQRIIEPRHFKGESGIKQILNRFYWKQLEKLKSDAELGFSDEDVRFIRTLIENELVKGGKRVVQSEETVREFLEKMKPDVAKINDKSKVDAVIDKLLDLRLIREEESHRGKVYEISHDTLLESIVKLRDERVKQEGKQKAKEQQALLKREKMRADENEKLRKEARSALGKAKKLESEANKARLKAEYAEKQAKRNFRLAVIALAIILGSALFIYFQLKSANQQKNTLSRISGRAILLSAARAYDDQNDALAFNLAWAADSVLDRGGKLVDSLVSKWDLREYSGRQTQVSLDGTIVVCQYENRMIQVFRITDTLRLQNKSLLFNNVDNFKLSEDGTTLALIDTFNKRFRFYSVSVPANMGVDTAMIWTSTISKNYEVRSTRSFLTKNYFAFLALDTLRVWHFPSKTISFVPYKAGDEFYPRNFCNNKSIFFKRHSFNKNEIDKDWIDEIVIKPNALALHPTIGTYFIPGNSPLPFFFNDKTKLVFNILPDTVSVIFKLLPSYYFYFDRVDTYDNGYLIIGHSKKDSSYLPLSITNKTEKADRPILLSSNAFIRNYFGIVVHNVYDRPRFINGDTLVIRNINGSILSAQKIARLDSAIFNSQDFQYSLSADKKRIYVLNFFLDMTGFIDLSSSPTFIKSYIAPFSYLQKLGGKDFFYSSSGLIDFHFEKPAKEYWKKFYEPLNAFSKEMYGIE